MLPLSTEFGRGAPRVWVGAGAAVAVAVGATAVGGPGRGGVALTGGRAVAALDNVQLNPSSAATRP